MRKDEYPAPLSGPRGASLLRVALLVVATVLALVLLPPLAGADLSGEPVHPTGIEWAAGEGSPPGEAGVLESGSPHAPEASPEAQPAARSEPPSQAGAVHAGPIIGTNDGAGWGRRAARRMLQAGIRWNRVELDTSTPNTVQASLADGFQVLAVAGNIGDSKPLSTVEPRAWGARVASELRGRRGVALAEAGNEMYLKGNTANPVQYGRMYLAAVQALQAEGVHTPLLFNMTGDFPTGGGWSDPHGWSTDAGGGGWLRTAVADVPGLAAAILRNGVSIHPYGAVGENSHDDFGTAAAAADEAVARAVLGAVPPFYVTEFGFDLARCGHKLGACGTSDQARKMRAAYNAFLADPGIVGVWWYQSHDDGTGQWGFMNDDNTMRPSFRTLSSLARLAGQ